MVNHFKQLAQNPIYWVVIVSFFLALGFYQLLGPGKGEWWLSFVMAVLMALLGFSTIREKHKQGS